MKPVFLLAGLMAWLSLTARAGAIYQCKQADGSVTFSNVACPEDSIERKQKGEHHGKNDWEEFVDAYRGEYYSPTNQVQRLEQAEAEARRRMELEQMVRDNQPITVVGRRQPKASTDSGTYLNARKKAMEEAGYRDYSRLTRSQKERVNRYMQKYRQASVPVPAQTIPGGQDLSVQGKLEAERMSEQARINHIEQRYQFEKRLRDNGAKSRSFQYNNAVRDCKFNPAARCW